MRRIPPTLLLLLLTLPSAAWPDISAGSIDDSGRPASTAAASNAAGEGGTAGLSATIPVADQIIVRKGERRLYLMRHGTVLRSYRVAPGPRHQGRQRAPGEFRTRR